MRQWIKKLARPFAAASTPASAPVSAVSAGHVENLEGRQLFASSLSYGINCNVVDKGTYDVTTKMLHDTGTHTVKLFLSVANWNSRTQDGAVKYIEKFHDAGFDVTLTVDQKKGYHGSAASVQGWFNWAAGVMGKSVDRWEIGNEPDHEAPWKGGHLASYVNDMLKPAYTALHAHGEKVISGGVSWNPADIRTMVADGMLKYCDMVGYHPYRNSVSDLKNCVAQVKAAAAGKPIVATEWNVRGAKNQSQWASEIKQFWPVIRDNFYAAYYYAAIKTSTMAGVAAVETATGRANGPFYSAYKSMRVSSSPAAEVAAASSSTASNKPADTTPTVDAFRLFEGDTAVSGYGSMSGTVTIKLSSLKGRDIQIRALTAGDTGSVKFAFSGHGTRTENGAPYKAFVGNWKPRKGTFTLSATAYSQDNAKGSVGSTKTLILKFV